MQYIYTGNSNITMNRHDFSLVGFDRNYSAYQQNTQVATLELIQTFC